MGSGRQNDLAYLKSQQRIVNDQYGRAREIHVTTPEFGAAPIFDSGMPARFSAFDTPHAAKIEYQTSVDLALFAFVNPLEDDIGSPLGVRPEPGTPVGGVAAVGKLTYGSNGVSRTQLVNMGAGQSIKLPFVGSSGLFGPILVPRYYTPDDATDPLYRIYRIGPGAGALFLTNDRFNNPQQSDLYDVLDPYPLQAPALTNFATCFATFGRGNAYAGDQYPKATRRFFGSLPAGGAGKTVRCPFAWGSSHVRLVGGDNANLSFLQLSSVVDPLTPLALASGPFAAGQYVPLRDDLAGIVVTNAAVAAAEVAFELQYTPGF